MKVVCGIYCIRNIINNKRYIGKSTDIVVVRWPFHKNALKNNTHYNFYLQRAWNKYGERNFKFEILEELEESDLNAREIALIYKYKTFLDRDYGYNLTAGGEGISGHKHTNAAKRRMSEAHRRENLSEETIKKMSESRKNIKLSEETKKKMSIAREGRTAWNKGIKTPEHIKKKISETLNGRVSPNKGKKASEETKTKMSFSRSGIKNWRAVFTEEDVRIIRKRYSEETISQRQLAKEFGVSRGAVRGILKGRTYKNVD